MKQFSALNTLLAVVSLESTDEGIYLNETQAAVINTALEANQQIVTERDNAVVARDQAVTDRTNAIASIDAIDPSIASATTIEGKIEATREHLFPPLGKCISTWLMQYLQDLFMKALN